MIFDAFYWGRLEKAMVIISAPWVVPVEPVIRNGSIVVAEGELSISAGGTEIVQKYPQLQETSYPCVLMPGLLMPICIWNSLILQNTVSNPAGTKILPTGSIRLWQKELIKQNCREEIVEAFTVCSERSI